MRGYIAPDNPLAYEEKCLLVFYPDDQQDFFLYALKGALSRLGKRYNWQAQTVQQARDCADVWQLMNEKTDYYQDEYQSQICELIPVVIGDEPLNINVSVDADIKSSGGCGCGCGGAVVNVTNNDGGTTIYYDPANEVPSNGGTTLNPTDPAPPSEIVDNGIDDWAAYDANACSVANYLADFPLRLIKAGESSIDRLSTVAALYALLSGFFPASWFSKLGSTVWAEIIQDLAEIVALESLSDVLNDIVDDYEANTRQAVVCAYYDARYSLAGTAANAISEWVSWVNGLAVSQVIKDGLITWINTVWKEPIVTPLFTGAMTGQVDNPIDCTVCAPSNAVWDFGTADDGLSPAFEAPTFGSHLQDGAVLTTGSGTPVTVMSSAAGFSTWLGGDAVSSVTVYIGRYNNPAVSNGASKLEIELFEVGAGSIGLFELMPDTDYLGLTNLYADGGVIADESLLTPYTVNIDPAVGLQSLQLRFTRTNTATANNSGIIIGFIEFAQ